LNAMFTTLRATIGDTKSKTKSFVVYGASSSSLKSPTNVSFDPDKLSPPTVNAFDASSFALKKNAADDATEAKSIFRRLLRLLSLVLLSHRSSLSPEEDDDEHEATLLPPLLLRILVFAAQKKTPDEEEQEEEQSADSILIFPYKTLTNSSFLTRSNTIIKMSLANLENARSLHLSNETLELAISNEFSRPGVTTHKRRLAQTHRVRGMLDRMRRNAKKLVRATFIRVVFSFCFVVVFSRFLCAFAR